MRLGRFWQRLRIDLVDRRLLPIPVVLVIGLIAVPVLAHRHRSTAEAVPPLASAPAQTTTTTVHAKKTKRFPVGDAKPEPDPFPVAKASAASAGTTPTALAEPETTTVAAAPQPKVVTTTTLHTAPSVGTATMKPTVIVKRGKPPVYVIKRVDLRFGADVVPTARHNVARLTPFPSHEAPIALLLGVLPGAKRVVFRISPDVKVSGEGTCVPRISICTQLVMHSGQRAFLTRPSGRRRLRLELLRVRKRHTKSAKNARRAYRRASKAGQCILDTVGAYRYDGQTGTLHRSGKVENCHYAPADASGSMQGTR